MPLLSLGSRNLSVSGFLYRLKQRRQGPLKC